MNREDIVKWTRQAGGFDATPEFLERFAALVAAAEREACAKTCDGKEREKWEQMANVLTGGLGEIHPIGPKECAAAIRARGQT